MLVGVRSSQAPASVWPGMAPVVMQARWLSVDEVAAHPGVSPATTYKWIAGDRTPLTLGRLGEFLSTAVD